jgi:hypothetical protein
MPPLAVMPCPSSVLAKSPRITTAMAVFMCDSEVSKMRL